MQRELVTLRHRHSKDTVTGYKLEQGDILQEEDVFESSTGKFERVKGCAGTPIKYPNTVWVRPVKLAVSAGAD